MVARENHVTSADHVTGEDHVVEREVLRLEEPGNLDYPVSEDSGGFCSQIVEISAGQNKTFNFTLDH